VGHPLDCSGAVEVILENISEKPKRGRPRVISGAMASILDDGVGYTERHQQNHYYAAVFYMSVPKERITGDLAWLFEGHDKPRWKRSSILSALGRLAVSGHPLAPEIVVTLSEEFCKDKPTTAQALGTIRQWRRQMSGEHQPTGNPKELANQLIRVINDYIGMHPGINHNLILEALHRATRNVGRARENSQ
jgi:hypothetical protein